MNDTPSAERTHIGIFGRRNAGKSSLINAITGQNLAIVSDIAGTTTDPVQKAMELLPLGPIVLIDTPGLDDSGALGALRVEKSRQALNRCDFAVLAVDARIGMTAADNAILQLIQEKKLPYLIAANKMDLMESEANKLFSAIPSERLIFVSAKTGAQIQTLKERIAAQLARPAQEKHIVADLVKPLDFVVLVVPLDAAAPKGRLILPQQQTIRDLLDAGAVPIVTRLSELAATLANLGKTPALVITDSQAFKEVNALIPADIPLTSFSILFSRYKGNLQTQMEAASAIDTLQDGDAVLISEGCTHHRQCGDIGTVKLPMLLKKYTGKELRLHFTSGGEFPSDLAPYRLIIHCGGCTLNEKEMQHRLHCAKEQQVPMANYGIAIAHMNGILKRSTAVFAHK